MENLVYREYLLAEEDVIAVQPVGAALHQEAAGPIETGSKAASFKQAKTRAIAVFEKRYLTDVLSVARGNVTKAAKMVGKERRAFGRLLKKHDIDKTMY